MIRGRFLAPDVVSVRVRIQVRNQFSFCLQFLHIKYTQSKLNSCAPIKPQLISQISPPPFAPTTVLRLYTTVKLEIDHQEATSSGEIKPNHSYIMVMQDAGGPNKEDNNWPPWVKPLLRESFFAQCKLHTDSRKSECNMYCLDCVNGALCSLCLHHHQNHRHIQIRRSSYHDVIRVSEIQKHLDINSVQTYVINSAKVVFLNKRSQLRPVKGVINTCEVCDRGLLDSFRFCSLGCKIAGTSENFVRISPEKKQLLTTVWDSEDIYGSNDHRRWRSNDRKRVRGFNPSTPLPTAGGFRSAKRRKGIPHRAPMGVLIIEY